MKQVICIIMLFLSAQLVGQNYQKIIISNERVGDGLFDFYAENPNLYPMQICLTFTDFQNMTASCQLPYIATVYPGKAKIFNLRRTLIDIPGSFKYTYSTRVGAYPVVYDPSAFYILPIATGKQTNVTYFDTSKSDDPSKIMMSFSLSKGDTVYSCREGVVCLKNESRFKNGYRMGENSITILHPDNSFSKYEVFADSQLFVTLGDTISAGAPLGLAGGSNYAMGAHVQFSVYYANVRIDSIEENKIRNYYQYVNPLFKTGKAKAEVLKDKKVYTQNYSVTK